jgi:hypothetical protein
VPRTPNRLQPQAGTQPQEGQPPQPVSVLPGVKPFTFHPLLALATLPCEGRSPLRRLISLLKRQADTMHKRVRRARHQGIDPGLTGPLGHGLGVHTKAVPKHPS